MPDGRMNVAVSVDGAYIMPLEVMLHSLARNVDRELHVYLLYGSLDEVGRKSIRDFVEGRCGGRLHEVFIDGKPFEEYLDPRSSWSVEMFYRLMLPYVLDPDVGRILWMDADMVVCGNIDGFYDADMGRRYLCGVPDRDGREHAARLRLDPRQTYFNSGMLLFNLPAIRKEIPERRIFEFLAENRGRLRLPDQDALNCLMGHNALMLDERIYNNQDHLYGKLPHDARVIHYVQNIKPWKAYYCGDRYAASRFWEYASGCGFRRGIFSPVGNSVGRLLFPVYKGMKSGRIYAAYHKLRYCRPPYRGGTGAG